MSRPRLIEDEAILKEAYALIMQVGPAKLTFESLGARVGLSPAALVKRFKNKQLLILEIDQYALQRTSKRLTTVLASTASPTQAIIELFTAELEFATSIDRFANSQEFLLMDFRHKDLYENYRDSFKHRHRQVVDLLLQAERDGELEGVKNHDRLARHLEMVAHGAGHVWAMTQEGRIENYISSHILFALEPYQIKQRQ
jgi:AcrR family transcriptional regulator